MDQIILTGMVLEASPSGDYDRRLVILSKERGKITAFARGARRQGSTLLACTQPFTLARFRMVEGRSAYNVTGFEGVKFFPELTQDVELTCYGCYMCEFAEYMTEENNDESKVLTLLYQALRALTNQSIGPKLAKVVYELKMLYLNGEGPETEQCVRCRSTTSEYVFSVRSGGRVCQKCAGADYSAESRRDKEMRLGIADNDFMNLSESAWYAIRFIAATPPEKLYRFTLSEEVFTELSNAVGAFLRERVHHTFRSLAFLETLKI
ncbi:MAG: DNA repair protein RecO [Lachnospiraceae bacterium]|nr:DNA repair protein RecO [Lachnospiraceae bacterium]